MATESFNVEAAKVAIKKASQEIEDLIRNFFETREMVSESFSKNATSGVALGGKLGEVAQRAFMEGNETSFNELKSKIDNFMNVRVEQIMLANQSMEQAVEATYRSM